MKTGKDIGWVALGVLALVGVGAAWHGASATAAESVEAAGLVGTPAAGDDEGSPGTLGPQLRLAAAVQGCSALLSPAASGTTRFSAQVVVDPVLGGVVDAVEVLDDGIGELGFRDCVVQAVLGAEVGEGFVGEVRFRYGAGGSADNAKDFLVTHPELVEQYPQLASIRDRAPDAPRSDEDATMFSLALANDPLAEAAFEQWSAEQGLDLSGVRAL